jgi:ESF2/ABP1 family protein
MPAQKRNEWQEAEEDEEGSLDYGSEAAGQLEDSRATAHKVKRRKVEDSEREEENADESDGDDSSNDQGGESHAAPAAPAAALRQGTTASITGQNIKVLTPAALKSSMAASKRTGVVYLSRVPPFMKPQKVKQLLSHFGTVGRVFLQPEDPASYARRKRFGGNKKRNFEDGWVEFADKKVAKLVVETLNATTIGGFKFRLLQERLIGSK